MLLKNSPSSWGHAPEKSQPFAADQIRTRRGGSSITRNRETGEVVSLADDLKAAATDALKKACSLLGIGLHLHAGDDALPGRPAKARPQRPRPLQQRQELQEVLPGRTVIPAYSTTK
jgi:hypothetical protein